jgi:hypothetical protein
MTGIEADEKDRKEHQRGQLTNQVPLDEQESMAMMKLSRQSLSAFLAGEPDLYTAGDAGVVHR